MSVKPFLSILSLNAGKVHQFSEVFGDIVKWRGRQWSATHTSVWLCPKFGETR